MGRVDPVFWAVEEHGVHEWRSQKTGGSCCSALSATPSGLVDVLGASSGGGAVLAAGYFLPARQAESHAGVSTKCPTRVTAKDPGAIE
jgi:hypothetical protein